MKKRAVRLTSAFFLIMLALTFYSRTVYRAMLPKVHTQSLSGGILKLKCESHDFSLDTDEPVYQYIPYELPKAMRIAKLHVKPGDTVVKGAPLATFYHPDGENILAQAKEKLASTMDAHRVWELELSKAKQQTRKMLAETADKSEKDMLNVELKLLEAGHYSGTSSAGWQTEIASLQALIDVLSRMEAENWVQRAECGGIVCDVYVNESDMYSGIAPIASIAPPQSPVYISFKLDESLPADLHGWLPGMSIVTTGGPLAVEAELSDGRMHAQLPGDIAPSSIINAQISFESEYQPSLVPGKAVHGEYIYALDSIRGEWGTTTYRARKIKVVIGDRDGENVSVLDGIGKRDRIIVSSTRELQDGMSVVLDGFE